MVILCIIDYIWIPYKVFLRWQNVFPGVMTIFKFSFTLHIMFRIMCNWPIIQPFCFCSFGLPDYFCIIFLILSLHCMLCKCRYLYYLKLIQLHKYCCLCMSLMLYHICFVFYMSYLVSNCPLGILSIL
jgi:hypothetical protein